MIKHRCLLRNNEYICFIVVKAKVYEKLFLIEIVAR